MTREGTGPLAISPPVAGRYVLLATFLLVASAMLPAQIIRLHQVEALPWLLADYGGRLFVLALLFLLPVGRSVLMREERLRTGALEATLWVASLTALFAWSGVFDWLGHLFPETRLGDYPRLGGWLYLFDLTCGLALVALHEEMVFRRLAAAALETWCRREITLVLASAIIFALYHWWTGIGNMIACLAFGVAAMWCYRRTGSLWPIGIIHYAVDVSAFA